MSKVGNGGLNQLGPPPRAANHYKKHYPVRWKYLSERGKKAINDWKIARGLPATPIKRTDEELLRRQLTIMKRKPTKRQQPSMPKYNLPELPPEDE